MAELEKRVEDKTKHVADLNALVDSAQKGCRDSEAHVSEAKRQIQELVSAFLLQYC